MATEYKIPLHRFDVNLLPPDARQVGTEPFQTAVILHFATEYAAQGQTAPWTSVFPVIHLEFGNENWNGTFQGGVIISLPHYAHLQGSCTARLPKL